VLEPVYDSYVPAVELAGDGPCAPRSLPPATGRTGRPSGPRVAAHPHDPGEQPAQPTGSVFTRSDLDAWPDWSADRHRGPLRRGLRAHRLRRGSARERVRSSRAGRPLLRGGLLRKTFHVTGWKVGWALAPRELMAEFRKVHQFVVFTVNTPVQLALADFMSDPAGGSSCRPSTSASATSSGPGSRRRASIPSPAPDLLPAGELRPAGDEPDTLWPSGSRARSASPPSRSRPSSPTAARTGCCASASPSRTRPWSGPASGSRRSPELDLAPQEPLQAPGATTVAFSASTSAPRRRSPSASLRWQARRLPRLARAFREAGEGRRRRARDSRSGTVPRILVVT